MSPRATQTCGICERVVSKYKCPCCLVPYCSVGCFKKHKELPCVKPSSTDEKPAKEVPVETTDVVEKTESKAVGNSDASPTKEAQMAVAIPVNAEEAKHVVDKTQLEAIGASATKEVPVARPIKITAEEAKYVVDKTQLEAIASSSEIREALKDESLQKLITKIDSSSNPLKELDEAMGEEAFRMLKDKILSNLSKKK
ncbi:zinc finger HIT domain-containing protein 3 isoform X2 [Brassica rapa]|uniref:zinc finger HIT domain-containing protein 3 isoform X2 n=1 Tax=Brassica campestris TaxID=3711 RepID=UPI00142D4FA9|nr:zinc finger HIT domain-containing protein 3 isoform X2 [Brassica rapa]